MHCAIAKPNNHCNVSFKVCQRLNAISSHYQGLTITTGISNINLVKCQISLQYFCARAPFGNDNTARQMYCLKKTPHNNIIASSRLGALPQPQVSILTLSTVLNLIAIAKNQSCNKPQDFLITLTLAVQSQI